jgi:hypothetical protein
MKRRRVRTVDTIRDLKDGALKCHTWRHGSWEAVPDNGQLFGKAPFGYREVQRCARGCGTFRSALFARGTGEMLTKWGYKYSDDYKVEEPAILQDYRREVFRRRAAAKS